MMEHIDKMNRAQLVDDAMNLARADQLPYTIGKKVAPKMYIIIPNTGYIFGNANSLFSSENFCTIILTSLEFFLNNKKKPSQ